MCTIGSNYPYDYGQFIDKYDIIVFEQNIRAFWQFMTPYITSMEYVMGDMPGIIYTDVSADLTVGKDSSIVQKRLRAKTGVL